MTPGALLSLSLLAYYNIPAQLLSRVHNTLTVGELARTLAQSDYSCYRLSDDQRQALWRISEDEALRDLMVMDYVNQNSRSGLVAYAFHSPAVGVIVAFRGSDGANRCSNLATDWIDNFQAPFVGSSQYQEALDFARRYADRPLVLTGHSKGAHTALYAVSLLGDAGVQCFCFDGQGFARSQLSAPMRGALGARAVNYVQQDDPVGALLFHPERRVFVRGCEPGNAHALENLCFDAGGWPEPAPRTLRSWWIEFCSQIYVELYRAIFPRRVPCWIQAADQIPFLHLPVVLKP